MRYFFYFIFFIFILFQSQISLAKNKTSFVEGQLNQLEVKVREKNKIESIASLLSQLKTFDAWPKDMDQDLKLYIAIEWFDQNNMKESEALMDTINPFEGYNDLWMYYRAIQLIHFGEVHKALPLIVRLEGNYPEDADVLYLKSLYLAKSGDLKGAIDLMNQLIQKNKNDGKLYQQRAAMHLFGLSYELAIRDFKKALDYLPKQSVSERQQSYLEIGLIYWNIKQDRNRGKVFLKKGVELAPNSDMVRQVSLSLLP